jgi:hypothetical protein
MTTRLNCLEVGCDQFMDTEEAVAPNAKYICARHLLTDPNDAPKFQEYAFDPELDRYSSFMFGLNVRTGLSKMSLRGPSEVRSFNDYRIGTASGFQIKHIRQEEKDVPDWAKKNEEIQKILLTAFPNLHVNQKQRQKAGRWAQIIRLHFLLGWSYSEVAEELNVKPNVVLMTIRGIKYTVDGKTWNGKPRKRMAT